MPFCEKCGAKLKPGATFCERCRQLELKNDQINKNQTTRSAGSSPDIQSDPKIRPKPLYKTLGIALLLFSGFFIILIVYSLTMGNSYSGGMKGTRQFTVDFMVLLLIGVVGGALYIKGQPKHTSPPNKIRTENGTITIPEFVAGGSAESGSTYAGGSAESSSTYAGRSAESGSTYAGRSAESGSTYDDRSAESSSNFAGFWTRFGAYLIDIIIILVFSIGIGFVLGAFLYTSSSGYSSYSDNSGFLVLFYLIYILVIWLYFAIQESSSYQATIGKRALNIKVVDKNGRQISFGKATLRTFVKFFPIVGFFGMLVIAFSENKQGLHDMIAKTLVIEK
jgi:uncharacterized RDD family membrane protein YckC